MFDRTQRPRRAGRTAITALLATVALAGCSSGNDQNSLEPAGPDARKILDLFTPFFWIAVVIGVGVVGGTIYVALRFREKPGEERNPKQVHGNTALEIGWTIVPALILLFMAVPTIAVIFDLAEEPTGDPVDITVSGRQWWWEFEYRDEGVITANEMHIPAGRPVRLTITAPPDGVIHSFWVPNLAGKKDAVPGRDHFLRIEADEPGVYLGQCAEYCGLSHANMRLRVIAHTEQDYARWVASQQEALPASANDFVETVLGEQWACTSCHAFSGLSQARIGPNLTRFGDRETFASGIFETNLDDLTDWVYDAPSMKPSQKLVGWMPSFREAGMSRGEAEDIARFLLCETATDPSVHPECGGSER